jgi:tRNA threonylcarbamoyladenosine biosynthesis protein TsaE
VTSFEVPEGGHLDAIAEALVTSLAPGDVVYLEGQIGAGKTTLVQACARALGVDEPVTSPTFALAHRYAGRTAVAHLDLYRLQAQPQRDARDVLDYLGPDAIAFVEWPSIGAAWLPPADVVVTIRVSAGGSRTFDIAGRHF